MSGFNHSTPSSKRLAVNSMPERWNIETLRLHLEMQIAHLHEKVDGKFFSRDKALELQAEANKIHFVQLNNEAARILKAAETTVSRDTWEGFQKEYQAYKASTERALTLAAGKASGVGMVTGLMFTAAGALIPVLIWFLSRPH